VDELICLHQPVPFGAIGRFYADFPQTPDAEVITLLDEAEGLAKQDRM
jgi:putative phosphoribosyl transferase